MRIVSLLPAATDIVAELDYESLTLAQLRARLTSLRVADLEALLDYEEATKSRAPFQTLLANRITRATGSCRLAPANDSPSDEDQRQGRDDDEQRAKSR